MACKYTDTYTVTVIRNLILTVTEFKQCALLVDSNQWQNNLSYGLLNTSILDSIIRTVVLK